MRDWVSVRWCHLAINYLQQNQVPPTPTLLSPALLPSTIHVQPPLLLLPSHLPPSLPHCFPPSISISLSYTHTYTHSGSEWMIAWAGSADHTQIDREKEREIDSPRETIQHSHFQLIQRDDKLQSCCCGLSTLFCGSTSEKRSSSQLLCPGDIFVSYSNKLGYSVWHVALVSKKIVSFFFERAVLFESAVLWLFPDKGCWCSSEGMTECWGTRIACTCGTFVKKHQEAEERKLLKKT